MAHQELGFELLQDVTKKLDDIAIVEAEPKKEGRQLFVLLAPDPKKIKLYNEKKEAAATAAETETVDS